MRIEGVVDRGEPRLVEGRVRHLGREGSDGLDGHRDRSPAAEA
jgi:hypothetical protein